MDTKVSELNEITDLQDACRHHWVIEMPNGPTSHGQCKLCGVERDFFNNPDEARVGMQTATAAA